jgi:Cysteine-rich CWC
MSQHPPSQLPPPQAESKLCPRCQAPFECRVGNIAECQCSGIQLTAEDKAFIASNYTDCLCRDCLLAIKAQPAEKT